MTIRKWPCLALAMLLALSLCIGAAAVAAAEAVPVSDAQPGEEAGADSGDPDDDWLYAEDDGFVDEEAEEDDGAEWLADVANDGEEPVDSLADPEEDDWMGAMDVFSWFAMQPLDVDESLPDPTGAMWRVLDERFNTQEGMLNMLRFYFSDEIVNDLWNSSANPYKEYNGYLYTTGEGRGIDDRIGETELTITNRTDTRVEMNVDVHYIEPDEDGSTADSFQYVRELINGEWKYTLFPFFW